jgi:delta 1-pyrroline-5-carboxylate dehydrogenase
LLCVQEDIAAQIIAMLTGAMAQLQIGDPFQPDTDVGPVIDQRALQRLQDHADYLASIPGRVQLLYRCELPAEAARGTFFAPSLYQIDDIEVLRGEVFGPILHLICYRRGEEVQLLQKIHSTGYGLTFGIQSRRSRWAEALAYQVCAGNIYINRNMVGAVVGVQPFGGRGLSGTGPKAGGPWYLPRLQRPIFSDQLPESGRYLPGPTGESNRLYYRPRGAILCLPLESWIHWPPVLALMLSTGNTLTLALPAAQQDAWRLALNRAFGAEVVQQITWVVLEQHDGDASLARWLAAPEFVAVCTSRNNARLGWLCHQLAARKGPLCPLLLVETLSAEQLLWEQVITINTTAVGGNAELLGA